MENSEINIDKLSPEQRAKLSKRLAESDQGSPNQEVSTNRAESELAHRGDSSVASQEESLETQATDLESAKEDFQPAGKVTEITKGGKAASILNRFFRGEESFDDLKVTAENAAEVTEEAMKQKKSLS